MRLTIRNSDGTVSQPYPCDWEAVMNKLAEYEDLEEAGRLVKLPCEAEAALKGAEQWQESNY